jgi:uncharacterized protein YcfJ
MKNLTTILIAVGAVLVGGVATAAYMNHRNASSAAPVAADGELAAPASVAAAGDAASGNQIDQGALQYADVVKVVPVTAKQQVYATVIGSQPVTQTSTTTTPHEVCQDVAVTTQAPRKDPHSIAGTAVGAVLGGVIGHQVGGGKGKKLATAAGAVAGGIAGNKIEDKRAEGKTVTTTERQCHTENATSQTTKVTGYNVTYRNPDGTTGTMRTDKKPGASIALGNVDQVQGYDVTYRYNGEENTVRMQQKPESDRLPVIDGKVVAAVPTGDKQG